MGYLAFAAKAVVVQVLVMAYSHWSPGASLGGFVYTATLIGYLWDHSRGKAGVLPLLLGLCAVYHLLCQELSGTGGAL